MDTTTGRFTSMDSYLGSVDDPVSLHKYLYANANPVNYIDPSGYSYSLADMQAYMSISNSLQIVELKVDLSFLHNAIISTATIALTVDLSRKLVDLMLDEGVSIDDAQKQYINSIIQMAKSDKDKKEDIEEENISKDGEYDNLREKGEPYPKHKVNNKDRSLPVKDEPNSSTDLLNPDGTIKQRRYYDSDGKAKEDIDYNHTDDGTHTFPHRHKWDWSQKKPRLDSRE